MIKKDKFILKSINKKFLPNKDKYFKDEIIKTFNYYKNLKNDSLFSVVIPTYNQCKLLKKAIYSVEIQTYKNYEIIVVDNSTNNETYDFVKTKKILYTKKFKMKELLQNQEI